MDLKQDLLARLQIISGEQLGVLNEKITEECTWAQLGADSLDRLQMTRAVEDAFNVEIPHAVGERLNTVGETVDHLVTLIAARRGIPDVQIEAATTGQQWAEMLAIRTQVFSSEHGLSVRPLPEPGATGVWHFLARNNQDAIGTLSVVDTTGNQEVHRRYELDFGKNERVARYAHLAILRPYRKRGIFKMLIEAAESAVIQPNGFAVSWLLYPDAHGRSSVLTRCFRFCVKAPVLRTEFGSCYVLIRREQSLAQDDYTKESFPVEACPI
jgi:acyl carrier protein